MGMAPPLPGGSEGEERGLTRAEEARLDAALAEFRDRTYAQWSAPAGLSADDPLADRRIMAAIRASAPPAAPRARRRYALVAAAAVGILAVTVALRTVQDASPDPASAAPADRVLLAAAVPGGDRGPLADGAALTRCLDAAAVPERQRVLLGAGPVELSRDRATVLLLPGAALGELRVLAVTSSCARGESAAVVVDRVLSGASSAGRGTP